MTTFTTDKPLSAHEFRGAMDGRPGMLVIGPAPIGVRTITDGDVFLFSDARAEIVNDAVKVSVIGQPAEPATREITEEEWLPLARDWAEEKWRESNVASAADGLSRAAFVFFAIACDERGL